MYKKILGIIAVAFSLVLCQASFADCGKGMRAMIDSLKLDDTQKAKIMPIMDQLKTSFKDSGSQMRDLSKQINEQTVSATMDQSAVNSLVDQKTKMIGDMIKAKVMAKNQIYAVLNDDQKMQLKTMMQAVEDKMAEKFKSCQDDQ